MFVETLHATSLQNGIVSIYISICYDFDPVIRNWILFRPPPSAFRLQIGWGGKCPSTTSGFSPNLQIKKRRKAKPKFTQFFLFSSKNIKNNREKIPKF